jgi:hypothetical protein
MREICAMRCRHGERQAHLHVRPGHRAVGGKAGAIGLASGGPLEGVNPQAKSRLDVSLSRGGWSMLAPRDGARQIDNVWGELRGRLLAARLPSSQPNLFGSMAALGAVATRDRDSAGRRHPSSRRPGVEFFLSRLAAQAESYKPSAGRRSCVILQRHIYKLAGMLLIEAGFLNVGGTQ